MDPSGNPIPPGQQPGGGQQPYPPTGGQQPGGRQQPGGGQQPGQQEPRWPGDPRQYHTANGSFNHGGWWRDNKERPWWHGFKRSADEGFNAIMRRETGRGGHSVFNRMKYQIERAFGLPHTRGKSPGNQNWEQFQQAKWERKQGITPGTGANNFMAPQQQGQQQTEDRDPSLGIPQAAEPGGAGGLIDQRIDRPTFEPPAQYQDLRTWATRDPEGYTQAKRDFSERMNKWSQQNAPTPQDRNKYQEALRRHREGVSPQKQKERQWLREARRKQARMAGRPERPFFMGGQNNFYQPQQRYRQWSY